MDTVGEILLVAGAAWSVLAAVGVNRFGDVYARMHAATKTTTLGVLLVLIGATVGLEPMEAAKLLLAGVLLFLTAPVGAHLIGRSVHRNVGSAPMRIDSVDELRAANEAGPDDQPAGGVEGST
ncbi:MAG: monovalent cation/H(+) antiporter subunit G [Acidimicrobiales bacterium]|nr:monovalent cation/H(+) antiporter subunit G [Acidimicrobiales bacterium]